MATIKQKKAFREVLKGTTIKKSMELANYSPTTASTTGKLTRTKGWQELLEKHLSDSSLTKKHRELLDSATIHQIWFDDKTPNEDIEETIADLPGHKLLFIEDCINDNKEVWRKIAHVRTPDHLAQDRALDKAYKLKGVYKDGGDSARTLIINITGETASRYGIIPDTKPEDSSS